MVVIIKDLGIESVVIDLFEVVISDLLLNSVGSWFACLSQKEYWAPLSRRDLSPHSQIFVPPRTDTDDVTCRDLFPRTDTNSLFVNDNPIYG